MINYLTDAKRNVIALSTFFAIFVAAFVGFQCELKTVTIESDGRTNIVETRLHSAVGIATEAGIVLHAGDVVTADTGTVRDGTRLIVKRAFPVTVTARGRTFVVHTVRTSPELLAKDLGYYEPDYTTVGPDTLQAGVEMRIAQVTGRIVHRKERTIEATTIRQPDPYRYLGEVVTVQTGRAGSEAIEEEALFENGVEIKRRTIDRTVMTAMVPTIVAEGTRDTIMTSRGDLRFSRMIVMEASAYLPTDGNGEGITATGVMAERGIVAVDPNVIPLGSRVFIPGYGLAVAADTGGMIIGNRIDLVMDTYEEAMNFGRRDVEVYIF